MGNDYSLERLAAGEARQRKRQVRNLLLLLVSVALAMGGIVYLARDVARSLQPQKVATEPVRTPAGTLPR